MEKQKVKYIYGVLECQFCNFFERVNSGLGVIGEELFCLLEVCLDNMIFCLGFVLICCVVCQFVIYCYIIVNGVIINILFCLLCFGDIVVVCGKFQGMEVVRDVVVVKFDICKFVWLEFNFDIMQGKFFEYLECEQILEKINEQLIVELYFK